MVGSAQAVVIDIPFKRVTGPNDARIRFYVDKREG
jgi:hypothetical protein